MAFIFQGSEPAMQLENQLFAIPASFTDRWKTEHERINPVSVLTGEGSSGDNLFHIPPSSHGLLSLNDIYLELEIASGSNLVTMENSDRSPRLMVRPQLQTFYTLSSRT